MNFFLPLNNPDFTVMLMNLYQLSHTNHCSIYLSAVQKLAADICNATNLQEKRQIFENFINKFTAVPDIWFAWRNIEKGYIDNFQSYSQNKHVFEQLKNKAMRDFRFGYDFDVDILCEIIYPTAFLNTSHISGNGYDEILKRKKELIYFAENSQQHVTKISMDVNNFSDFWNECEEYLTMEISKNTKRKVEEAILIEECLKGVINNEIKKMETLIENATKDCVIDFIERRIFKDPYNLDFWKLYISYLEKQTDIDVLNVYSRYCRLFVDDERMSYKYYDAIKKFHQSGNDVSKWLLDIVKLEADFVSIDSSKNFIAEILEELYDFEIMLDSNLSYQDILAVFKQQIKYQDLNPTENSNTPGTVICQNFAFHKTMIYYILTRANSSVLHKLHKSCKYFYKNLKVPVIHKLSLTTIDQNFMYQNSAFINKKKLREFKTEKIWLSNAFTIDCVPDAYESLNLSETIFPKFYKCTIRFLSLTGQKLSAAEFECLTKSKSVESLLLEFTDIVDSEGDVYTLEKILQQIPNGHTFKLTFVSSTNDTARILSSLNHHAKIKTFDYKFALDTFDTDEFSNFVMKTGTVSSKFSIQRFGNQQYSTMTYRWISPEDNPVITVS